MKWNRVIYLLVTFTVIKLAFNFSWTETFGLLIGFGVLLAIWYCAVDLLKFLVGSVQRPSVHYHFHEEIYEEHKHVELHPDFTRPYSARLPKELEKGE